MRSAIAPRSRMYSSQLMGLLGGLNNAVSDEMIRDDELSDCSNYVPDNDQTGMLRKRDGLTAMSTQQTEKITSIFDGQFGNYFSTSTEIHDIDGALLHSGLTSTDAPDWTAFAGKDVFVNGNDNPVYSSDGTSFAELGGSPPQFKYIKTYNNILFGGGHDGGKLRWADLGTSETWTATNEFVFTQDTNNPITALAPYRDVLVVFCRHSFYHVYGYGTEDLQISHSSTEEGCTSHRSVCVTPYGLFWWSKSGLVWSKDGVGLDFPSKRKIPKTISGLNREKWNIVHGFWNPNEQCVQFWLCSSGASSEDTIIYYYPTRDAFFLGHGTAAEMSASGYQDDQGVFKVYGGSSSATGYLYELTGEKDGSESITAYLETKREYAAHGPRARKRFKRLLVSFMQAAGTYNVTYSVYLNDATSVSQSWALAFSSDDGGFTLDTDVLDTGTLGTASLTGGEEEIGYNEKYYKVKHRIYDTSAYTTRVRGIINEGYLINA